MMFNEKGSVNRVPFRVNFIVDNLYLPINLVRRIIRVEVLVSPRRYSKSLKVVHLNRPLYWGSSFPTVLPRRGGRTDGPRDESPNSPVPDQTHPREKTPPHQVTRLCTPTTLVLTGQGLGSCLLFAPVFTRTPGGSV